jgi:hypothetical protein
MVHFYTLHIHVSTFYTKMSRFRKRGFSGCPVNETNIFQQLFPFRRRPISETWVRSQAILHGICGGQIDSGTVFFPENSGILVHHQTANATYSSSITDAHGGGVGRSTAIQDGRSRVPFPMVSLESFINLMLPASLWPCGRLSL